ncbi:MAG: LysE family translocator [Thermomicrobiales bacterium]
MSTDQTLAFVLFALAAAITPGPSNLVLAATGAKVGIVRGLPALAGVAAGMAALMATVALGLGTLVTANPVVMLALKTAGIAFILWLAWQIATARHGATITAGASVGFWQAAVFQWANPKAWLVTASAAATFLPANSDSVILPALHLGALFAAVAAPSALVWLLFGATLQRLLATDRAWRQFNLAMALLLAGSVVLFLV